jgi:hypothetical protein
VARRARRAHLHAARCRVHAVRSGPGPSSPAAASHDFGG